MPKVNDNYFEIKRNQILDAAFQVCIKKPVYKVTMKDIIKETGLSQGGVYKYFPNLDEVLFALLNRETKHHNLKQQIDEILEINEIPEITVSKVFDLMSKTTLENVVGFGKIFFEFSTTFANEPERYRDFQKRVKLHSDNKYIQNQSLNYILQKIDEGYFIPKLPIEDIISFIITSIDGIERDMILSKCYNFGDTAPEIKKIDGKKLMNSLCFSVISMLGGNIEFTNKF